MPEEAMILHWGADGVDKAVASIKSIKNALNELQRQGQLSLGGLKDAIAQFQQRLLVATNPIEIKNLTNSIAAMKDKAKELQTAGVENFAGQFKVLGTSVNSAISPLRSLANIIPGLGISGLIAGLTGVFTNLINSAEGFDHATLAMENMKREVKKVNDSLSDLKENLDFSNEIQSLLYELSNGENGLKQFKNSLALKGAVSISQQTAVELGKAKDELKKSLSDFFDFVRVESDLGALGEKGFLDLIFIGQHPEKITDNLLKNFNSSESALLTRVKSAYDQIQKLSKDLTKSQQSETKAFISSLLDIKKDIDKVIEDQLKNKEPVIKPKKIKVPDLDYLELNVREVRIKAKETAHALIPPPPPGGRPLIVDMSFIDTENKARAEGFARQRQEAQKLADTISGTLAPAFSNMFGAILEGKDPIKAMFQTLMQSVQQLIQQLIQAAIRALVLKIIASFGTGGTSNLLSIASGFNFTPHATGGPVAANRPIKVGETGTELFVPSTAGRIIPNNQLNSLQGSAQPVIMFNGRLAVSGNELKLLLNRTDRYQNSNV